MSTKKTVIKQDGFGVIPIITDDDRNFEIVKRYTLTNKTKASVTLITWGAGIQSIRVPNRNGVLGDVVLGFDDIDGYWKNRNVGRILGPVTRSLTSEITPKSLIEINESDVDASTSFDNVNWDSYIYDKKVIMSYLSRNRSDLYPGDVLTQVKYSWSDENELMINVYATSTRPTPIDITSFCLLNLAGHGMGSDEMKKHVVSINTNQWLHSDVRTKLPTGSIRSVERTIFDLRNPTELNTQRLDRIPGGGYDHFFNINSSSIPCYRFHARVLHPESGRSLEVNSDQAGLHFYTGNDFPSANNIEPWNEGEDHCSRKKKNYMREESFGLHAKDGVVYKRHAHNHPQFYNQPQHTFAGYHGGLQWYQPQQSFAPNYQNQFYQHQHNYNQNYNNQ